MKPRYLRAAAALLCLWLLTGCRNSTIISRENQLALRDTAETAAQTTGAAAASDTIGLPGTTVENPADPTASDRTLSTAPATMPDAMTAPTTTAPTAAPATAPSTASTSAPATVPTTAPTAAPTTTPTTAPTTASTAAPAETTAPPESTTEPVAQTDDPYDISNDQVSALAYEILAQINVQRADNGLPALTMDTQLAAISSVRAYECSIVFSHTRPDGRDCFTALDDYGYHWQHTVGENLLCSSEGPSAAKMVEIWMNSEGHRANILNENFTAAGIGVYVSGGTIYVANFFVG